MKLNIEKLKSKLNNISSEVSYNIEKRYHEELHEKIEKYFNIITFNHLVEIYIADNEDIESNINFHNYFIIPSFSIEEFHQIKTTLDFIEDNEEAIKTAMLESIE